jgi:DNA invertase Pin-like site-specific DNA recombinase
MSAKPTRKTFFYGRSATHLNDTSIDRQLAQATDTATHHGFQIDAAFSDPCTSGNSIRREGFDRLRAALREHPGSRVIVEDLSRLTRDVQAHYILHTLLTETLAELWDTNGPLLPDVGISSDIMRNSKTRRQLRRSRRPAAE